MKKNRALLSLLCLFVFLLGISYLPVNASNPNNLTTDIKVSAGEIKKGDKIEVLFSFNTNGDTTKGFNAFQATLDYDENVFEKVTQSDFEALNSWQEFLYNPDNRQFVAINKSGELDKEEVIKLTLTAKVDTLPTTTAIKIKDVVVSDGDKDIAIKEDEGSSEVQVEIVQPEAQQPGGGSQGTQNPGITQNPGATQNPGTTENSATESTQNTENAGAAATESQGSSSTDQNVNTDSSQNQPASDEESSDTKEDGSYKKKSMSPLTLGILIFIEILILIAIIMAIKNKLDKENKEISKKSKILFIVVATILILAQIIGVAKAAGKKGELNGDGEINYKDVSLLQQHLIDLNKLPDNLLENADVNLDGKITVTDLCLLVQKIENSLEYKVTIQSNMENYYPKKNEEIELKFLANATFGEKIKEVTINGETYKVKLNPETNDYSVKFSGHSTSGIKEYKFTEVKLNAGKKVKVDFTEKVDVLKDAPVIENYKITELAAESKAQVNFDLKDIDNSIQNAKVEVADKESSKVIYEQAIQAGTNEFVVALEDGKDYLVNIYVSYNLDTNELVDHEKDNTGSILEVHELRLNIDYKFEFNNLKTFNEKGEEIAAFNKNQPINIKFTSKNATIFNPKTIKVNDAYYDVTKDGETYSASINGITNTGEHEIKVQEVVLDNGKVFELQQNNTVKVNINKEMPKVQDVTINELDDKVSLDIALKITDADGSITRKKIVIKNDKGEVVSEKEFDNLEYKGLSDLGDILSSSFTVEVVVDYDLSVDGTNPQVDQVIYTETITAKPRAKVLESSLSKTKFEKGESLTVTYKLESNQNAEVKYLVVNGVKAIATKNPDNTYQVTINVGDKAGLTDVKLSKVIFGNDAEVSVNKVDSVEILKSAPTVNNYSTEDDFNNDKVKVNFNIVDIDNAFVSGKVELYKKDGTIHTSQEIKAAGENNFDLSVVEDEEYNLKIKVTYKRDEDATETKEEVLLEKPIQLVKDYKLQINDIKTSNNGVDTKYFNRDEKIKVSFTSTNSTRFIPVKVKINEKEYNLTKLENNIYETVIDGFASAGVSDIIIQKVWMDNGKELNVDSNSKVQVEILKLAPTVQNFTYDQTQDEGIKVSFNIQDSEAAFKKGKLIIKDKNSTVFTTENLKVGKNEFTFKTTLSEDYTAEIFLDYDLDSNALGAGANEYSNIKVLDDNITISKELIELKDIESVNLYRKNGDLVQEITEIDTQSFNPQEYIAKITMKNMPTLYTEVKAGKIVGKEFRLVLNYNNAVQYEGSQKTNEIEVKFAEIDGNIATNITFDELIAKVQQNPTATINLTSDLDASNVNVSTATYLGDFKGTINGNGHVIKNLKKPLFNSLQNATIKDLIIENVRLSGNSRGTIANTTIASTISNVHINHVSIDTWNNIGTGGFVGNAEDSTIIQECSANNIFVKGYKFVGGFTGFLKNNSIIKDSYIKGTVQASWDAIGGVIGQTEGEATIENIYADVTMDMAADWATGGLVGHSGSSKLILKNSISLATGNQGAKVIGSGYNTGKSSNNYEIQESTLKSNANGNQIKTIAIKDINEEFFAKVLGWDNKVWNLSGVNSDKLPTLNNLDINNQVPGSKPENDSVNIPEFDRISKLPEYDSNKEIAYHNMNILMPYFDAKVFVDYGNKVAVDDILNTQKIASIIAYDKDSKMISGLNSKNYNTIQKIKIVFESGEVREYAVTFNKIINNIATYKLNSMDILYAYNRFVLNTDISLVNEIITEAQAMDYATNIASVTPEDESRLYVDYYNESVKNKISDVVIKILQSEEDYNLYLDNEVLKAKIKNDLLKDNQLQKLIYTYNYYDKWYNIDIGGILMSDLLFFNVDSVINKNFGIEEIVKNTMSLNQNDRATSKTMTFYDRVIKPQTNKAFKDFFEYIMKIEGFNDADEWFKDNFKGILREKAVEGKEDEIDYRAWTMLTKGNSRVNILLPILTAPQEDMYIISLPSQVMIGSLNRYNAHVDGNVEAMNRLIDNYSDMISNFYSISSTFIENSTDILNSKVHIQYDTRFNFPGSGNQENGKTQDPVVKWVYEAVGAFAAANGSGAYANGNDVFWVAYTALGEDFTFGIFTHETAHNQDGYYFYEGKWRRTGTGAEDHADANIAQDLGDGSFVFNIRNDFNIEDDTSNNLTLDRIKGKENIYSYYKEMFETYYVLDYLTAEAILKLTPEQQANLVAQANYVGDSDPSDGGQTTEYKKLTADEIRAMNLTSIQDLWDNRIVFRNPGTVTGNMPGSYGGDTHYNIYWYQPHNDIGRPDSYSFKRLGFEMLGVAGYTNGYVAYRSGMAKNDLEALRIATNDPNMTWEKYKMSRFDNVKKNLHKIKYFDVNEAIELYKNALIKDAAVGNKNETNNVRRVLYGIVKRATGDFTHSTIYGMNEVKTINSAEALIEAINNNQMGNYKLTSDIDFSNIDVSDKAAYIDTTFLGTLDGAGFKVKGLKKPLFMKTTYANIKNLTIETPQYLNDASAALMVKAKNSMVENLNINGANINRPIAGSIEGSLQLNGSVNNSVKSNEITSIDDLLKIEQNATGLEKKMKYVLTQDIDASTVTGVSAIISGEFLGEIDGNGKKIYNLKAPLFQNLKGKVNNLRIEDVNFGTWDRSNVGALAGETNGAVVEDIKLNNITIQGRDNVAAVVGISRNTTLSRISATNIEIKGHHFYAGGFIGRSFDTKIYDVLVQGKLEIRDTHNGGLIGAINRDTIERAYVDVDVTKFATGDSRNRNAGLYGNIERGPVSVKDIVVAGNMDAELYKVTPTITDTEINDTAKYLSNVYEADNTTGKSNVGANDIKLATDAMLKNIDFYKAQLNWSDSIWDFSKVSSGNGPSLK